VKKCHYISNKVQRRKKIAKQEKYCEGGKSANKRQNEVRLEGIIAQDA
jgi:hypothetical protein